ncbi:MAG: hypothetical protein U0Y10_20645 [Spirosomataceae bacterium]
MRKRLPIGMLLLGILLTASSWANIAQPGVWSSGGTGSFSLLYPEDDAAYKKIQMWHELVLVQLYKGYAAVKGTYWMQNNENAPIRLKVGYPMSGDFKANGADKMVVSFDSLYRLAAKVDGVSQTIRANDQGWYVWETTFKPKAVTKVEVYFVVNTNESELIKGYNHLNHPIFSYVLQTGSIWKNPIEQGLLLIQLKDGLTLTELKSAQPDTALAVNTEKQLLRYTFHNLTPSPRNNLVLVYSKKVDNFNFKSVATRANYLFEQLDQLPSELGFSASEFPNAWINTTTFEQLTLEKNDEIEATIPSNWLVSIGSIGLLVVLVGGVSIWLIVKLVRKIIN